MGTFEKTQSLDVAANKCDVVAAKLTAEYAPRIFVPKVIPFPIANQVPDPFLFASDRCDLMDQSLEEEGKKRLLDAVETFICLQPEIYQVLPTSDNLFIRDINLFTIHR